MSKPFPWLSRRPGSSPPTRRCGRAPLRDDLYDAPARPYDRLEGRCIVRTTRLSCVALLVGGVLLAAAFAQPARSRSIADEVTKGGTLRIASPVEPDYLDPALAYTARAWTLEYATCAKLFNFPDAAGAAGTRVVPEVVDRYTISGD